MRIVRWGALLALIGTLAVWGWYILNSDGRAAVKALSVDQPAAPVAVLAAPRVLRPGEPATLESIERELRSGGYRLVSRTPRVPGEFHSQAGVLELYRREHIGPFGPVPEALVEVCWEGSTVSRLTLAGGRELKAFALEPAQLGAFRGPSLEERRPLPLDRFPQRLIDAVLAAEDSRFFQHRGLDPRGILRAIWVDLRGGALQGASTITQQVIKNRVVGRERTWLRKAHEALLAAYVEGRISKERLLAIYLNEVYLGQRGAVSIVGFPAAGKFYFGKNLDDLQLNQMALMAGMISSPGRYDPRRHPEAALEHMRWVLDRLVQLGKISRAQADAAGRSPLGVVDQEEPLDPAGDVMDGVLRELLARGYEPRPGPAAIEVYTTIDVELEAAARRALDGALGELEQKNPARAPLEGAVVILDQHTGEVLALVGGRKGVRGAFHRALDARRQPGSAFKPFVALAAFNRGDFLPSSIVEDEPLTVATAAGPWKPENYDHEFRGAVTVRRALEESLNVPMVRVGLAVGPEAIIDHARKAGITGRLPVMPSVALGVGEVAPLELAGAYATLAGLGVRRTPLLVRGVGVAPQGRDIALAAVPAGVRLLSSEACWMVLDCLGGTIERGTAKSLAEATMGQRVAAKTGTTQDGRDAWFVFISGRAVVVVYVGRDDDRPADLTGASGALPVVKRLLGEVGPRLLAPLPSSPEGMRLVEVDPETGGAATARCPVKVLEPFPAGQEPKPCSKHLSPLKRLWQKLTGSGKKPAKGGQTPPAQRR